MPGHTRSVTTMPRSHGGRQRWRIVRQFDLREPVDFVDHRLRLCRRHHREGIVDSRLQGRGARAGPVPQGSRLQARRVVTHLPRGIEWRRLSGQTFRRGRRDGGGAAYTAGRVCADGRRQQRAFHGQLLALPGGRFQGTQPARARSAAPTSPTGRSAMRNSSLTTRASTGRSASPARRDRSTRRARSRSRCRRCRSSPPAYCCERGAKKLGLHCSAGAARDPVAAAQRAARLHQLRLLHVVRLRGRRQVVDARCNDSARARPAATARFAPSPPCSASIRTRRAAPARSSTSIRTATNARRKRGRDRLARTAPRRRDCC